MVLTHIDPDHRALATLLSACPDAKWLPQDAQGWLSTHKQAAALGLFPYLADVFRKHPELAAPEHIRQAAESAQAANLQLHLRRMAWVRKIIPALEKEGIPV